MLDKYVLVPTLACVFALIVSPLLSYYYPPSETDYGTDYVARIFWPAMAAISIILFATRNRSRRLIWPPHILCLFACLAFAGASVLWAFNPGSSFVRFMQQAMIMTAVVGPALLAHPRTDVLRVLFLCFAFASIVNVFFVLSGEPEIAKYWTETVEIGYTGYFLGKNYLGECAALTFLLAVHETLYPGHRRALGIIVMIIAIFLIFKSESKTALGLAILLPLLAALTLLAAKKLRLSPAIILLSIPFCYFLLGAVSNSPVRDRLSYMIFGDPTLTGRTIIWDFATDEIARRPLLGWGYQSFWLVGADAPSVVDAPGWVKSMPDAHSGYYDATLEMGHIGYYLLVICIIATLHAIGRVAQRDGARAWLMLSVALYFLSFNYLESLWMRGFEFLWVVFLIIAAEIGRYWQPSLERRRVQIEYRRPSQGARLLQGARRQARKLSA